MTLSISGPMPHASGHIELTTEATERARIGFNPSGDDRVARLKTLAAAFYSECERIIEDAGGPGSRGVAQREAATAMTQMQMAAMFAVSAATAGK